MSADDSGSAIGNRNTDPDLVLVILQNIHKETAKTNQKLDTGIAELHKETAKTNQKLDTVIAELHVLNERFEHFLSFVGRDVAAIKERMDALEARVSRYHARDG